MPVTEDDPAPLPSIKEFPAEEPAPAGIADWTTPSNPRRKNGRKGASAPIVRTKSIPVGGGNGFGCLLGTDGNEGILGGTGKATGGSTPSTTDSGATVDVETTTIATPEGSAAGRFLWPKSYNLLRLFGILALFCLGAGFAHSSCSATSALLSSQRYDSPWPTSPPATFAKSFTPAELDDEAYALNSIPIPQETSDLETAAVSDAAKPRMAVCVLGAWRSLDRSASSIRQYMLDPLDADAYAVIEAQAEHHTEARCELLLGPRASGRCRVGKPTSSLYREATRRSLESARGCLGKGLPGATRSQATVWLQQDACLAMIQGAQTDYATFAYTRTDQQIFHPLPPAMMRSFGPDEVIVPDGDRWGGGLTDNMLIGGGRGFRVASSLWRQALSDGSTACATGWVPERFLLLWLQANNVSYAAAPVAYCKVDASTGACRYPGQLAASMRLVPGLVARQPSLASLVCAWTPCECSDAPCTPQRAPAEYHPGQTREDWDADPYFCNLRRAACQKWPRLNELCCLADGSVRLGGQVIGATRRCARAAPPADDGTCVACPEAVRLASIRAGRIDKSQLELVVVRGAREDLSWSEAYAAVRTVYCHGACDTPGAIELPNVGLEAHAYLYHLVSRYDSLADRTVFMHGREPTCGFFGEPLQGGHLLLNVSVADYMDPELGETFMPVTMLMGGGLQGASLRSAFAATPDAANARVPRPPSRLPLGRDGDHWLPWEANDFQQFIRGVASRKGTVPMLQFDQFFDSLFGRPPPRVLQVAQGAQFAADRTALRRVPLPALRSLLELVEAGHAELPYYMEAVWFHLLHPDTLDAPIDGMPSNGGAPLPFLHHLGDAARRRLDNSGWRGKRAGKQRRAAGCELNGSHGRVVGLHALAPVWDECGNEPDLFDLVVTHCLEEASWIDKVAQHKYDRVVVYCKCGVPPSLKAANVDVRPVPNVGQEVNGMLRYIIERYDDLPRHVRFTSAGRNGMEGENARVHDSREKLVCKTCDKESLWDRWMGANLKGGTIEDFSISRWKPRMYEGKALPFVRSGHVNLGAWVDAEAALAPLKRIKEHVWASGCNVHYGEQLQVTREQIRNAPVEIYRGLLNQSRYANDEVSHYIERLWGPLMCAQHPSGSERGGAGRGGRSSLA